MKKKDEKIAYNVVTLIGKIKEVKLEDKERINDARIAYEMLDSNQKNLIRNIDVLEKAEKTISLLERQAGNEDDRFIGRCVDEQIMVSYKTLFESKLLLELKRESVYYVRALYDGLNNQERFNVNEHGRIKEMEEYLKRLEEIEYNKVLATEVIKIIEMLPSVIVISDSEFVNEAYEAYNTLNDEAKEYVTNISDLNRAIHCIKDIREAMVVVELIDNLDTRITLDDWDEIEAVNVKYALLSDSQKEYVTNYAKLIELNNVIKELLQTKMDKKSANNLDRQIKLTYDIINDEKSDLEMKHEHFNNCMNMYDSSSVSVKSFMLNEELLDEMQKRLEELDLLASKRAKAMYVYNLIKDIPYHIDVKHGEDLIYIQNEYDKLDSVEKAYVVNLEVLEKAFNVYNAKLKAFNVVYGIDGLDSKYSLSEVNRLEQAYQLLDAETKNYVYNYEKLVQYLNDIKKNENMVQKARELDMAITNFRIVNLDDEEKVLLFRKRYEELNNNVRSYVTHIDNLDSMANSINCMKKAMELDEEIAIIDDSYIVKNIPIIKKLDNIYKNMDNSCKQYVKNGESLRQIAQRAEEIEKQVQEIIDSITEIDKVEIDEGDDIARCRLAYELLDDELKVLVTNYEQLLDKERDFIKLRKTFDFKDKYVNEYLDEQILLLQDFIDDEAITVSKKREYLLMLKNSYQKLENKEKIINYDLLINLEKKVA